MRSTPAVASETSRVLSARVIAGHGRQSLLRLADGRDCVAVTRGRRTDVSVGDEVQAVAVAEGQAVIERVLPRRNEFKRSDEWRSKRLAANLDRVGIVIAPAPPFSEELLVRALVCAQAEGIDAGLIANKADLPEHAAIEDRLALYESLGYPVFRIAAKTDPQGTRQALAAWLAHGSTLLLGQSGMGKSTLVNLLVPDAGLATQAISLALDSGRHTTTFCRAFNLPGGEGAIIDSPGFQTFGLAHLSESQVMHGMREFVPRLGRCRFHNCTHRSEPGCAIRQAVDNGQIDPWRHALYVRLADEVRRG